MPDVHALLSASASSRWLSCPPSARAEEALPETTSVYAEEGTRAHALAEKRLKHYLAHGKDIDQPEDCDAEMWEATGRYVDVCMQKIAEAKAKSPDAKAMIEARLDYSPWAPEGFGTGDMVIVSDAYIEVCDLKYGKGVPVNAVGNTQMRLYALGAYEAYGWEYGAENVRMTIIQPRLDSVTEDCMTLEDLLAWGETVKPKARLAYDGAGQRYAGEHCRWCKVRATCKVHAEHELAGIRADFPAVQDLSAKELANWVLRKKDIEKWLTEVADYVLYRMLKGDDYPNLKLVAGRSVRTIHNEEEAAKRLLDAGHTEAEIYKPKALQTLTALEKAVGKKNLAKTLGNLIEKPQGKPTVVSIDDKRAPYKPENDTTGLDDELIAPEVPF